MPLKMFETQKQINEEIFSFSLVNFCFYQAKGQQACPSHLLTKYQMTIFWHKSQFRDDRFINKIIGFLTLSNVILKNINECTYLCNNYF